MKSESEKRNGKGIINFGATCVMGQNGKKKLESQRNMLLRASDTGGPVSGISIVVHAEDHPPLIHIFQWKPHGHVIRAAALGFERER